MSHAAPQFFTLTTLILVLILLVFMMKYASAAYRSRIEIARQTATVEAVTALRQQVADLADRMAAMEKLLREVE